MRLCAHFRTPATTEAFGDLDPAQRLEYSETQRNPRKRFCDLGDIPTTVRSRAQGLTPGRRQVPRRGLAELDRYCGAGGDFLRFQVFSIVVKKS